MAERGTMEPPQGQKQQVEEATKEIPLEPTPPALEMPPSIAPEQPTSMMQVVPPTLLFRNDPFRNKTMFRQRSDMGTLWRTLANDPSAPPLWREIARSLGSGR